MPTIEFNGTGGLMEGDFGTADINVNQDSTYEFDGVNDYIEIADGAAWDGADKTASCWIKPTVNGSAQTGRVFFSRRDNPSEHTRQVGSSPGDLAGGTASGTEESYEAGHDCWQLSIALAGAVNANNAFSFVDPEDWDASQGGVGPAYGWDWKYIGPYSDHPPSTSGSGTGAEFLYKVTAANILTIGCTNGGSGYAVSDTITVSDHGASPGTDIVLTVTGVTAGGEAVWETTSTSTDGGTGNAKLTYGTTPLLAGNWYNIIGSAGGSTAKLFVNGILESSRTERNLRGGDSTIHIGCGISSGDTEANFFNGVIADCRVINNIPSTADVEILSSKINTTGTLSRTISGHWKGTEQVLGNTWLATTGGITGDATGHAPTEKFDAFSVNAQGSGASAVTTDGTFTVTQGKLEGLGLTSLALDGSDDDIQLGAIITLDNDWTISSWFRADEFSTNVLIGNSNGLHKIQFVNSTSIQFNINNQGNENIGVSGLSTDTWHHFVVTRDDSTGETKIYVDGVLVGSKTFDANNDFVINRIGVKDDSPWDGDLRDVRIYDDIILSTDQVASLYSGSYNVTPTNWWKLDDSIQGTEITTAADSGTGTTSTGSITGLPSSGRKGEADATTGWQNGTLDLDSTLTIDATGTLSAPRGELQQFGVFHNNGTFTHNSGKVIFNHNASTALYAGGATFFNIDVTPTAGNQLELYESLTVLGTIDLTGSDSYCDMFPHVNAVTLTLGDADNQGTLDIASNGRFRCRSDDAYACTITGHSALQPGLIVGDDWDWDWANDTQGIQIAYLDFSVGAIATGGSGQKITVTGDIATDNAFTVTSGDTLDLNGQRMECSGHFTNLGATNFGGAGSMLIASRFTIDAGTYDEEAGASLIVKGSSSGDNQRFRDTEFVGDATTNILINNGATSCDWSESQYYAGNLIVASPFVSIDSTRNVCGNLTIPTGGTLNGSNDTITVKGDFTTSGGLLGPSAQTFTGTNATPANDCVITADASSDLNLTGSYTIESWIRTPGAAEMTDTYPAILSFGSYRLNVGFYGDGQYDTYGLEWWINNGNRARSYDNDGTNYAGLAANTWYHITYVADSSANRRRMYIDGKEVLCSLSATAEADRAANPAPFVAVSGLTDRGVAIGGKHSVIANTEFTGTMDKLSIWDVALTPTQIRALMFKGTYAEMQADNTNFPTESQCVGWYDMNEGTGNTVDDTSTSDNNSTSGTKTWAGAGTFTPGTSTLVMSGTGKYIYTKNGDTFRSATFSGSTTMVDIDGGNNALYFDEDLTVTGTLTSSTSEYIRFNNNFITNGGVLDLSGDVTGVKEFINDAGGNINVPAHTTLKWRHYDGSTGTLTGNVELTSTATALQVGNGSSGIFNTNGYDLKLRAMTANAGSNINIEKGSSLIFNDAGSSGFGASAGALNCKGEAAAIFDGTNNYLDCGTADLVSNDDFSVSLWFYVPAGGVTSSEQHLFTRGGAGNINGFTIRMSAAEQIYCKVSDGANGGTKSFTPGQWNHVVVTLDRDGNGSLYLNNATAETWDISMDSANAITHNNWGIGAEDVAGSASNKFDGQIADVRLYSDLLTSGEVTTLYNSGSNPATNGGNVYATHTDNLVGHWKLNEAGLGRAYDFSGNMNHGVNKGMTSSVPNYNAKLSGAAGVGSTVLNFGDNFGDNYSGSISLSLWFQSSDTNSDDGLFQLGDSTGAGHGKFQVFIKSNKITFRLNGTAWKKETAFTDTASWHHLVCIYDTASGTVSEMYLDNSEVDAGAGTGSFPADADMDLAGLDAMIGYYYSTTYSLAGKLADVRIYNTALTSGNVTSLWNSGGNPTAGSYGLISGVEPLAWWKLDGNISADDASTNNNHGVPYGARPNRIRVMSELSQAAPVTANLWDWSSDAASNVTANTTTFEQYSTFGPGNDASQDVSFQNCTFQSNQVWQECVSMGNFNSLVFSGNTINATNSGTALRMNKDGNVLMEHITITNTGGSNDIEVGSDDVLEFSDSNFDITKITMHGEGAIVSMNHNDSVGETAYMNGGLDVPEAGFAHLLPSTLTTLETQNVTLYNRQTGSTGGNTNLRIDVTGKTFGGLTIPADTTVTHESTHAFTVTGNVVISGGTYTGGTGVPTFGSLKMSNGGIYNATSGVTTLTDANDSYAFDNDAKFYHNKGTVHINTGRSGVYMDQDGDAGATTFWNLDVTMSHGSSHCYLLATPSTGNVIENNFHLIDIGSTGFLVRSPGGTKNIHNFNVGGEVKIESGAKLELNAPDGNNPPWTDRDHTFGSLVLNGGEYVATSESTKVGSFRNIGGTYTKSAAPTT